jgi:hypothetical protein
MVHKRYCHQCGAEVTCKEERRPIAGSSKFKLRLFCPKWGRQLADIYDQQLAIQRTRKG